MSTPCAGCKFLRRKCTEDCVFKPYFPPDQPQKFFNVHKIYGAANVSKLILELNPEEREAAVNSLEYEADARIRDPIYGCVGTISMLQHKLKQVTTTLHTTKLELATYIGPSAMMPMLNPNPNPNPGPIPMMPMLNLNPNPGPIPVSSYTQRYFPIRPLDTQPILSHHGAGTSRDAQHQQQLYENEQQEMLNAARQLQQLKFFQQQYEQEQVKAHQSENLLRDNSRFDSAGPSVQANPTWFTQLTGPGDISLHPQAAAASTAAIDQQPQPYDHGYGYQQQHQPLQQQYHDHQLQPLMLPPPRADLRLQPCPQSQPHHGGSFEQQYRPPPLQQLMPPLPPPPLPLQPPPQLQQHHGEGNMEGEIRYDGPLG